MCFGLNAFHLEALCVGKWYWKINSKGLHWKEFPCFHNEQMIRSPFNSAIMASHSISNGVLTTKDICLKHSEYILALTHGLRRKSWTSLSEDYLPSWGKISNGISVGCACKDLITYILFWKDVYDDRQYNVMLLCLMLNYFIGTVFCHGI